MNSSSLYRSLYGQIITGCDLHQHEPCMIAVRIRDDRMQLWLNEATEWDPVRDQNQSLRWQTVCRLVRRALQHSGYACNAIVSANQADTFTVETSPKWQAARP